MRCSQPDHTCSRNRDDLSLQEDSTVRRFPRVGAQFQTRISKSTGPSIRPTPERMSVDFPYISEKEAGQPHQVLVNGMFNKSIHRWCCKPVLISNYVWSNGNTTFTLNNMVVRMQRKRNSLAKTPLFRRTRLCFVICIAITKKIGSTFK
jgi:hypothetical protein